MMLLSILQLLHILNQHHYLSIIIFLYSLITAITLDSQYTYPVYESFIRLQLNIPEYLKNYPLDKKEQAENYLIGMYLQVYYKTIPSINNHIDEFNKLFEELTYNFESQSWIHQLNVYYINIIRDWFQCIIYY